MDYASVTLELTFNATSSDLCTRISIIDDFDLEGTESFSITLSSPDSDVFLPSPLTTVSIIDNDMVVIGLEREAYNVSEERESVEVCVVVISGAIQRRLEARLMTGDITAGET